MTEYAYDMNERPPAIGAIPKGFIRFEERGGRYGRVIYGRPLTSKEVYDYELEPVIVEGKHDRP